MLKTLIPHNTDGSVIAYAKNRVDAPIWRKRCPFDLTIAYYKVDVEHGIDVVRLYGVYGGEFLMLPTDFIRMTQPSTWHFDDIHMFCFGRHRGLTIIRPFVCHHTPTGEPLKPLVTYWSHDNMLRIPRLATVPTTEVTLEPTLLATMKLSTMTSKYARVCDTHTGKTYPMQLGGDGGYRNTVNEGLWFDGRLFGRFIVRQSSGIFTILKIDCPCGNETT